MATGDSEVSKLGVSNLHLDIQGNAYVWNFIVHGLEGHDILLGMDWLSVNQAFLTVRIRE